jgi:hypothetical protein
MAPDGSLRSKHLLELVVADTGRWKPHPHRRWVGTLGVRPRLPSPENRATRDVRVNAASPIGPRSKTSRFPLAFPAL